MRRIAPLCALALLAAPAHADDDDDDATGTTIVVGLRLPRPVRDVPATVTVITRAEIERSPRHTADDLVRTLPSVATFRRSSSLVADPTSQGVNLRGVGPSGVSRALVLHDGLPLNDPFGGWVYWRAIPLAAIERVEVTPSGASAVFGNFAIGGVVQLFTRRIEERAVEAIASTGSFETHRAAVRATDRFGAVGVAVDADVLDSAGYAPIAPDDRGAVDGPAATRHAAAGARVEWLRGSQQVRAHARWFDEHLDAGTRHTTADVRALTAGAGWLAFTDAGTFEAGAFVRDQLLAQERARVADDRATAEPSSRQRVPSDSQGASATWTSPEFGRHTLVAGVDAVRVAGRSTDTILPAEPMPTSVVERAAGGEQRFAGVFVQDAAALPGDVDVHAAVRLDTWENVDGGSAVTRGDGSVTETMFARRRAAQLNPRVGVLKRLGEDLAVRASGFRAFRAPTLNELYRPFQVGTVRTDANADLAAETVWGVEGGPEVVAGTMVARATAFWNWVRDPVQNVTLAEPSPTGAQRQRQNLGRAEVRGYELELSWRPAQRWIATAGYTFVDAVVTAAPDHPDLVGKRLAQDPRHRATGTLTFDDPAIATVTVQGRFLGRQYEDDLNTLPMDDAALLDVLVARRLGAGFAGFVTVENAFDRRYLVGRAGVDTIGAPRTIQVGVRFRSEDR